VSVVGHVHGGYVHGRRVRVLAAHLSTLMPRGATLLDVGCGDGLLSSRLAGSRPDLEVTGIDVLARPDAHIPVSLFDGARIPLPDRGADVVLFVDVLHHTPDPAVLLREAARVARRAVVIKDHLLTGFLAGPTLRFMDWIGNARHGVELPYVYWPPERWRAAFGELGLAVEAWTTKLGLYPWPADLAFGRSLHFIARLAPPPP
jgi:SAM-dependent methyltransferase